MSKLEEKFKKQLDFYLDKMTKTEMGFMVQMLSQEKTRRKNKRKKS